MDAPAPSLRPAPSDADDERRATLTLVGSASLFGVMAIGTRLVSARIPGPQIALVRFVTGILAVGLAVLAGRARLRPRRWGWLFARGLFGGVAVFAYFSCIEHAGVAIATLLNYTAPVWSLLFAWAFLGETPRRGAFFTLGLTLAGVALVLGGQMRGFNAGNAGPWEVIGLLSAVCSGMAVTSIRAVRRRSPDGAQSENSWTVFASFTTLGALATVPGILPPLGHWVSPTALEWGLLMVVALLSIVAQLLMTRALSHVGAAASGIVHQLTVVIAMLCGVVFLGERLTAWSVVGSVLTVAGVAGTVLATEPRRG